MGRICDAERDSRLLFLASGPHAETSQLTECFQKSGLDVVYAGPVDSDLTGHASSESRKDTTLGILCLDHWGLMLNGQPDFTRRHWLKLSRRASKQLQQPVRLQLWQRGKTDPAALFGNRKSEIDDLVTDKINRYRPTDKIIHRIDGHSHRSLLHVLQRGNQRFVRKTFLDGHEDYLAREIAAREKLTYPWVGEIVETGPNYLLMPFYDDRLRWSPGLFQYYPRREAQLMMHAMAEMNAAGFALVDWHPGAALFDKQLGLKIVDFEYCQQVPPAADFRQSVDYLGARNFGLLCPGRTDCGYRDFWQPATGLDYASLMQAGTTSVALRKAHHSTTSRIPRSVMSFGQKSIYRIRQASWKPHSRKDGWIL